MVTISVKVSPGAAFQKWVDDCKEEAAKAVTAGVTQATRGALTEMRQQMKTAGLGNRLPNALRATVYPQNKDSLDAAGVIQPKDGQATSIFSVFTTGATIRGRSGNWLAIPTDNVPKTRGLGPANSGGLRHMTPVEVEAAFNQDLIIRPTLKPNVFTAWINAVDAKSRKGFRRATPRRLSSGRQLKLVLMFTLVRQVGLRSRLNPAPIFEKWAGLAPALIYQSLQRS